VLVFHFEQSRLCVFALKIRFRVWPYLRVLRLSAIAFFATADHLRVEFPSSLFFLIS
jgi:hypothetical protein